MSSKTHSSPQLISYRTLRRIVGVLGIMLPIVLVLFHFFLKDCSPFLDSISAYYHSILRNVFVGVLISIAFFMFAYKGYTKKDIWAGKIACFSLIGVVSFPTFLNPEPLCAFMGCSIKSIGIIHFIFAASFFLTISWISLRSFSQGNPNKCTIQKLKRNKIYKTCGIVMLTCIGLIVVVSLDWFQEKFPKINELHPIFWLETIALWAFGISWLTKGDTIYQDSKNPTYV